MLTSICLALFTGLQLATALKPSSGCGKPPSLAAGNHSLTVNGTERWYLLKLPDGYKNDQPYRLIFTLHAAGGDGGQVAAGTGGYLPWYGLPPLINDTSSAIYVSPNALERSWYTRIPDGLTLISNIVDAAKAGLCVDESLIFATGFSSGAEMLYSIGCSLGKTFRGLSSLSGNDAFSCRGGTDPVAFLGIHGVSDNVLPIAGGRTMRDKFLRMNGCTPLPDRTGMVPSGSHVKTVYQGCKEGYPVTWIEFDGGHTPQPRDRGANKTFAPDETWAFFSQFK